MILLTNLVQRHLPCPQPRVLDIGCGHGNFVIDELNALLGERIGLDVDRAATTGNTSVHHVVINTSPSLPFHDQEFDLVLSLWVLEHIQHPTLLFQEIDRILKPGGIFCFVTPNKNSALIRARRLVHKRFASFILSRLYGREDDDIFPVYYRANSLNDLRALAEKTHLSIETLIENTDPSYTSFNESTYRVSRGLTQHGGSLFRPHLVGIFKKPL